MTCADWFKIDGPHGGVANSLRQHDTVIMVAGGTGVTFIAPQLLALLYNAGNVKNVHFVWAIRSQGE